MTSLWCELKCLQVAFSNDDGIPKRGNTAIENKFLAEAVLESIIGKNGVSPGARLSVAERLAQVMKNEGRAETLILGDKKFVSFFYIYRPQTVGKKYKSF